MSWEVWTMKSKTSFFNTTLFRSFLGRFWPLPLAVLAVTVYSLAMPVLSVSRRRLEGVFPTLMDEVRDNIYGVSMIMILAIACAAILTAVLLFGHLHSRKALQFYHGLPLRRGTIYTTLYLTGLLLIALPMALGMGLVLLVLLSVGCGEAGIVLLQLLGAGLAALLALFALAVIACELAGQVFGAVLIYVGFNCAVALILTGAADVAARILPGILFERNLGPALQWLTPLVQLIYAAEPRWEEVRMASDTIYTVATGLTSPLTLTVYGVLGVLAGIFGLWLYRRRPGEAAGEMIAFRPIRVVCKIFGALMISAAGTLLTLEMGPFQEGASFPAVLISVLAFGALGWIAAEMVVRKSLRVFDRKTLTGCGILLLVLLAGLMGLKLDIGGRGAYVPPESEIEETMVNWQYSATVHMRASDATALHRAILAHPEELAPGQGYSENLSITYSLKNGRSLTRSYDLRVDWDEMGERIPGTLSETLREYLGPYSLETWLGDVQVDPEHLHYGELVAWGNDAGDGRPLIENVAPQAYENRMLSTEETFRLYDALVRDIRAGRLEPAGFTQRSEQLGEVEFTCYQDAPQDLDYYRVRPGGRYEVCVAVPVTRDMTETVALLTELGYPPAE